MATALARQQLWADREARLRCQADRGVGGTVTAVAAAALDQLEEELVLEGWRVELQVLGVAVAVVEDVAGAQSVEQVGRDAPLGLDVVVVVLRDRQDGDAGF